MDWDASSWLLPRGLYKGEEVFHEKNCGEIHQNFYLKFLLPALINSCFNIVHFSILCHR